MKYKRGDKVRVKPDLEVCAKYGNYDFVDSMTEFTFSKDYCECGSDRGKERSKTAIGIAKAMAEQWSKYIEEECK